MENVIGFFVRHTNAVPFLADVVAAFRAAPSEVRDPKAVASEIGKLLEAEKQRSGTDWASNLRRARAYYRHRKWGTGDEYRNDRMREIGRVKSQLAR